MQGTSMGFEDAAALARLLARVSVCSPLTLLISRALISRFFRSRRDQIPTLLNGFAGMRHARALSVMAFEHLHSPFSSLPQLSAAATPEDAAAQMRDHCLATLRMLGCDLSGLRLWDAVGALWAHDAEDAADNWWVEWGLPAERMRGEAPDEQRISHGPISVAIVA